MIKINANNKLKKRIFFAANELDYGGVRLQADEKVCNWVKDWLIIKKATVFIYSYDGKLLRFAFTTERPIKFFAKIIWNEIRSRKNLTEEQKLDLAVGRIFGLFSK